MYSIVGVSVTHLLRTVINVVCSSFERPPKSGKLRVSTEFVFQVHFKQFRWWDKRKRRRKRFCLRRSERREAGGSINRGRTIKLFRCPPWETRLNAKHVFVVVFFVPRCLAINATSRQPCSFSLPRSSATQNGNEPRGHDEDITAGLLFALACVQSADTVVPKTTIVVHMWCSTETEENHQTRKPYIVALTTRGFFVSPSFLVTTLRPIRSSVTEQRCRWLQCKNKMVLLFFCLTYVIFPCPNTLYAVHLYERFGFFLHNGGFNSVGELVPNENF